MSDRLDEPSAGAYLALSAPMHSGLYLHIFCFGMLVSSFFSCEYSPYAAPSAIAS